MEDKNKNLETVVELIVKDKNGGFIKEIVKIRTEYPATKIKLMKKRAKEISQRVGKEYNKLRRKYDDNYEIIQKDENYIRYTEIKF